MEGIQVNSNETSANTLIVSFIYFKHRYYWNSFLTFVFAVTPKSYAKNSVLKFLLCCNYCFLSDDFLPSH